MSKGYVIITGASSGIGVEFAKRFAKEGYPLILVARREERLQKLAESLPVECIVMSADLSKMDECRRVIDNVRGKKIDILINNAGFGYCDQIWNIDDDLELEMVELNVKAVHLMTKLVLRDMLENDKGYILNVASSAGLLPAGPYMSTYYATKSYVTSFTRGIAEELRRKGSNVYIGCLCPGPVDTEFNRVANVKFALKGISAEYCANYCVDQMFKGKVAIVPSLKLKVATVLGRLVPPQLSIRIAANQQRRKVGIK